MKKIVLKKWYLIISFVLSLFLVVVTILGFTPLKDKPFMETLNTISVYVLCFFVAELIVLIFTADNFKSYLKENWISIVAVLSSISVSALVDGAVAIGSLTGLKALKGVKAVKAIKGVKGIKLFKVTKGAKVVKSVKLAKKTQKAREEARKYTKKGK